MKKVISSIMIIYLCCLMLSGCADPKTINGIKYETYGFLNQNEVKNPKIKYRLVMENVIWSIILCESLVFPVYFIGFSLYEPIGVNNEY